ncbi:tetratricopeptide repeat protein [Aquipuribacter nitratireducens]|uniref:Tetratricopeptide repeat protein n=1 Tax=Aquipuribacter nitratireducens TaxID=650104 RepID=A0ABW0GNY3_9MICO
MTQPSGLNLRGAVDLTALARPQGAPTGAAAPGGTPGPGSTGVVVDVAEADFEAVLQQSLTVPVVVDLWAEWCGPCKQLSPVLEKLAREYEGRWLLAKVDVDANPRIAQAFQVQSIPMVVALLKGQPVPLFTGAVPEAQARQVLDELLRVAEQNGVTGRVETGQEPQEDEVAAEPPLPPLHAEAAEAFERGDYAAAARAFERALAENPADADATAGLAQAHLFERVSAVPQAVMAGLAEAAAADPGNVEANLAVADRDLFGGHVEDAFARLVELVRRTAGEERAAVRTRLVELFEVVGTGDPRVVKARGALASALF